MPSPVPKFLRTREETETIDSGFLDPRDDLDVVTTGYRLKPSNHPAKYYPGLPTKLVELANTENICDPFAGTGRLAEETGIACALNDIDKEKWALTLLALSESIGCSVSFCNAIEIPFTRECFIFSPPYYPRTDRTKMAAHNDEKRGRVVGYRSGYDCNENGFIGDPSGTNGISIYRNQMREIYKSFITKCEKMIVVTKNQTRLGTELRLDIDTILTAKEAGWNLTARHGWKPPPSHWQRYNIKNGRGVEIEDVFVFEKTHHR